MIVRCFPLSPTGRKPVSLLLAALALTVVSLKSAAHAQVPPGTDIWVFPLREGGRILDVASGARVTNRPGYDNQPCFLPGGSTLLFTSIDESGQADILRLSLETGVVEPLTDSAPESEYSATLMPSGDRISVIRVEADSTQRLWSFDLAGGTPTLLLPGVAPVGYHAWLQGGEVALFVLGSPSTLQIASLETGQARIVARDIGRSLHQAPDGREVSFVQWDEEGGGVITLLDPASGETRAMAPLLEGNEYYAWTPWGDLLMGRGSSVYRWVSAQAGRWEEMADLTAGGVTGISRIAVSPDGDRIAVVGVGG